MPDYRNRRADLGRYIGLRLFRRTAHMKDPSWFAAYRAVCSSVKSTDVILGPMGDWPPFPCRIRFYAGPYALQDATVLLLHKGSMTGLDKAELAEVVRRWHCIYANDVFVVLCAAARPSLSPSRIMHQMHMSPLRNYIQSRRIKRRAGTIYYVHVPKTGGTSMWQVLRRTFPSNAYYADMPSFLARPPAAGEYDLVGLHFLASTVEPLLRNGDWLIGMLRCPTERFLSSITHARRPHEDPTTFTAAMRAMRETAVLDFLRTDAGRAEVRLQLLILGCDYRVQSSNQSDDEMRRRAVDLLRRPGVLFAPSDQSRQFIRLLSELFGFRLRRLGRLNANDPGAYASHSQEFSLSYPAILRENGHEVLLYEEVRKRFAEQCRNPAALLAAPAPERDMGSA